MKTIYKTISLEQVKCRIPNTLISVRNNTYLYPSNDNFYDDNFNGNYNAIPCDIVIPLSFSSETRVYDFSTITDKLSTSINLMSDEINEFGESYSYNDDIEYAKVKVSGNTVSCKYDKTNNQWIDFKRYCSYNKLHKWFLFFKEYFKLLKTNICENSDKQYFSAEDFYYSQYESLSGKNVTTYQDIDKIFIARGGKINNSGITSCDLYDWMRDYIFIEYNIKDYDEVKKYASEWKTTIFNILSVIQWFKWFEKRYFLYKDNKECNLVDDCCDCKEYYRLGGNDMYMFLKKRYNDIQAKAKIMEQFSTYRVELNIPLSLIGNNHTIGEQSILAEEWQEGVDYSKPSSGAIVYYGGKSFYNTNTNDIIDVEPSVFIGDNGKGYEINEYNEINFIVNGKSLYDEYLPSYIKKNESEFKTKDNENVSAYSYSNTNFVTNPTPYNMAKTYNIIIPSGNTHIFSIENNIYNSFYAKTLIDNNGNDVSGSINTLLVQYLNPINKEHPYVEYKGNKYVGQYDSIKKNYYFTFKSKPTQNDWYYLSENEKEFVYVKDTLYEVKNGKITVVYGGYNVKYTYPYINGYIDDYNNKQLIGLIDNTYCNIIEKTSFDEDTNIYEVNYVNDENSVYGKLVKPKEWEQKPNYVAYWVKWDEHKLYIVAPYNVYKLGEVKGTTKSRLNELIDPIQQFDKNGNTLLGFYNGENVIPMDNEILDIQYHINNTSELELIQDDIQSKTKYYWGNILSDIEFYFKDENGDVIKETITSGKQDTNLEAIKNSIIKYVNLKGIQVSSTTLTDIYQELNNNQEKIDKDVLVYCYNNDTFKYINEVQQEYNENDSISIKISKLSSFNSIIEIFDLLKDTIYCKLKYNIGSIIQQKYSLDNNGKYHYGNYELTNKYHNGVEYSEEYYLTIDIFDYYTDVNETIKVNYFSLSPTKIIEYYEDQIVTEDSEKYSANEATFIVETNYDLTENSKNYNSEKYSREINTTYSDGRQMNFYNGLMASPTITEEYNFGISSSKNVNDDIYINRGVNYAFDKHLKLLEVKTLEALEQYNNGFFNLINN